MTWPKASPVLTVAVVFDLLRIFFEFFWFFGPVVAAVACTATATSAAGTSMAGIAGKAVAAGCTTIAGGLGFFGVGAIETFGVIMAMATGFLGWLVIGLMLMLMNARIFKEEAGHALWFVASLAIAEVPLIGAIPSFTLSTWRMYHIQIKSEKAKMKKYQQEQGALQQKQRQQAMMEAQLMQYQASQIAQTEQEASNDAAYAAEEIPEGARKAA